MMGSKALHGFAVDFRRDLPFIRQYFSRKKRAKQSISLFLSLRGGTLTGMT